MPPKTIAAVRGRLESRILRQLWKSKDLTARALHAGLNGEKGARPLSLSTIQTMLRKMQAKGLVRHRPDGREFVFEAAVQEDAALASATRDLLGRMFGGSALQLAVHLIERERMSPEEIDSLRRLIAQKRRKS